MMHWMICLMILWKHSRRYLDPVWKTPKTILKVSGRTTFFVVNLSLPNCVYGLKVAMEQTSWRLWMLLSLSLPYSEESPPDQEITMRREEADLLVMMEEVYMEETDLLMTDNQDQEIAETLVQDRKEDLPLMDTDRPWAHHLLQDRATEPQRPTRNGGSWRPEKDRKRSDFYFETYKFDTPTMKILM